MPSGSSSHKSKKDKKDKAPAEPKLKVVVYPYWRVHQNQNLGPVVLRAENFPDYGQMFCFATALDPVGNPLQDEHWPVPALVPGWNQCSASELTSIEEQPKGSGGSSSSKKWDGGPKYHWFAFRGLTFQVPGTYAIRFWVQWIDPYLQPDDENYGMTVQVGMPVDTQGVQVYNDLDPQYEKNAHEIETIRKIRLKTELNMHLGI